MKYTKDEILSAIIDIIYEMVNRYGHKYDKEQITSESNLITDFGFDSLDRYILFIDCEEYFKKQGYQITLDVDHFDTEITIQQLVNAAYKGLLNPKPELKDDGVRIPWGAAQAFDIEEISKNFKNKL